MARRAYIEAARRVNSLQRSPALRGLPDRTPRRSMATVYRDSGSELLLLKDRASEAGLCYLQLVSSYGSPGNDQSLVSWKTSQDLKLSTPAHSRASVDRDP